MPNTITNRQMFLILFMVLTSASTMNISKIMLLSGGAGGWVTILIAAAVFAFMALAWTRLNGLHEGKMLFDYSKGLIGRAGAYSLGIYFALSFLIILMTITFSMSSMMQANFLPNTPIWATSLAALPVVGFIAYKGVTNSGRLVEIYGVIVLLVAVPTHLFMLKQGDIDHILPLYIPAETGKVLSGVRGMIFPFLGIEILSIFPFTKKNGPKAGRTAFFAVIGVGLFYVLNALTSIMVIGEHEIVYYNYPLIAAIRQVELPYMKIFQRVDLLFLTVGFLELFAGQSIIYLGIVEYICRMLPKIKRVTVTIAVGFVAFIGILLLKDVANIVETLVKIISAAGLFLAGILPLVLIVITKVKNRDQKKT